MASNIHNLCTFVYFIWVHCTKLYKPAYRLFSYMYEVFLYAPTYRIRAQQW